MLRPPSIPNADPAARPGGRLNLLVSYGGWRDESWADMLPRLLDPMGVCTYRVDSAKQAFEFVRTTPVHLAVVDLALPMEPLRRGLGAEVQDDSLSVEEAGPRVLELLGRLEAPPPTLVIKRRKTAREGVRELTCALNAGAFSVIEPPVQLETILEVMRRALRRFYSDRWPAGMG
jgi:DNA-binding response OmpR family regulator